MSKISIEDVALYLPGVGYPLVRGAERVKEKLLSLKACKREIKEGRQSLLAAVKQNYVDSEIEAAEAMFSRRKADTGKAGTSKQ